MMDAIKAMSGANDNDDAIMLVAEAIKKRDGCMLMCTGFNEDGTVKSGRIVSKEYTGQELIDKFLDQTAGAVPEFGTDGRRQITARYSLTDRKVNLVPIGS